MRRYVSALVVASSLFVVVPAFARAEGTVSGREPRFVKIIKKLVKSFLPTTNGDYIVPPKP